MKNFNLFTLLFILGSVSTTISQTSHSQLKTNFSKQEMARFHYLNGFVESGTQLYSIRQYKPCKEYQFLPTRQQLLNVAKLLSKSIKS